MVATYYSLKKVKTQLKVHKVQTRKWTRMLLDENIIKVQQNEILLDIKTSWHCLPYGYRRQCPYLKSSQVKKELIPSSFFFP